MPRYRAGEFDQGHDRSMIHDALFQMQPELRLLEGVVATLQLLGEARDAVDTSILGMLAQCSQKSVAELRTSWQSAFNASVVRNPNE